MSNKHCPGATAAAPLPAPPRAIGCHRWIPAAAGCVLIGLASVSTATTGDTDADGPYAPGLDEIPVTARRIELLGSAATASEGLVAQEELALTPAYRPGQILETVPGLIVTLHSGEGKANQFLLRGYNLDHGTDLATHVDAMPINAPTHAHGQGYTDLNFLIPELAQDIRYSKGPYRATVGDFGAVGSVDLSYRDSITDQIAATAGSFGFQRLLAAGSTALATGQLLGAAEYQYYDGPFSTPDAARKENVVLRYSGGERDDGYSLTGMYYHQRWTSSTDIPLRAIADGLPGGRFGNLDPTDGGLAERASLSGQFHKPVAGGEFGASAFFIYNALHMYNNFTHFLTDPLNGDQEQQFENRRVVGGKLSFSSALDIGGIPTDWVSGVDTRYDQLDVGRLPSIGRVALPPDTMAPAFADSDRVYLFSGAVYAELTTRFSSRWRTVVGLRDDYQHGTDIDRLSALHATAGYGNGGTAGQSLLQPKGSIIFSASDRLEVYASAGRGFHSADLRGVNQDRSVDLGLPRTSLLSRQEGQELGLRSAPRPDFVYTLALYNLWQQSETTLNPDVGQDVAGPPSRRYGVEINVTYQPLRWLELYGSLSANHARYTRAFDDGTGHLGNYIADAPIAMGSVALYVTGIGRWSGGIDYRYLGRYALSSGPCVDSAAARDFPAAASSCANAPTATGQVNASGFGQLNFSAHYALNPDWTVSLGVYNLLNAHAAAAQFWYVDRLKSEIGAYPDGRADVHQHPLEPLMARFTLARHFGS